MVAQQVNENSFFSFRFFYLYLSVFSLTWKSCSFWKRWLPDVKEKVSTYLSIICIEHKKKTKLTSFAITIFSTIIFSIQQFWWLSIFLPLYPIVYCKSAKFWTNFDLFEFDKLCRCASTIWHKNCFCSSSVAMLLPDERNFRVRLEIKGRKKSEKKNNL